MTEALRLEWRTADELDVHPDNWRRHPERQTAALRDVIDEIGWAGVLLYNERTNRLIDGHARKAIARPDEQLPVLVGDWDIDDEHKILATLDPIAAMAETDADALEAVIQTIGTESEAVQALLDDLQARYTLPAVDIPDDLSDIQPDEVSHGSRNECPSCGYQW